MNTVASDSHTCTSQVVYPMMGCTSTLDPNSHLCGRGLADIVVLSTVSGDENRGSVRAYVRAVISVTTQTSSKKEQVCKSFLRTSISEGEKGGIGTGYNAVDKQLNPTGVAATENTGSTHTETYYWNAK